MTGTAAITPYGIRQIEPIQQSIANWANLVPEQKVELIIAISKVFGHDSRTAKEAVLKDLPQLLANADDITLLADDKRNPLGVMMHGIIGCIADRNMESASLEGLRQIASPRADLRIQKAFNLSADAFQSSYTYDQHAKQAVKKVQDYINAL